MLAVGLGLLVGLVVGALGGGGSVLTVPALVFALGLTAQAATTASLVIVGITFGVATVALCPQRSHLLALSRAAARCGHPGVAARHLRFAVLLVLVAEYVGVRAVLGLV